MNDTKHLTPYLLISFVFIISILGLLSCTDTTSVPVTDTSTLAYNEPPTWSKEAIWYQIFVERFRNGDVTNDQKLENVAGSLDDTYPDDWKTTDWGHDWYTQEDWAEKTGLDFYRTVQMRRVGGDLQGVKDKIPYLKELGITAIYFNPINDAPTLHKFDARNYRHVDVNFGPDPIGDNKIIANETPEDPSTWQLTAADKMFFELVDELHQNGIRTVVDFSWNHTGRNFWAFQDIIEKQEKSKYKDWFEITHFDNPDTEENEFEYEGWFGIKNLPDIKKHRKTEKRQGYPYEGDLYEAPKQHIFHVAKKYMDPNGDGDVSDGIDGMRLDVAEHVPMGFWRDFRKHVRGINPEFYLVGENWWTAWPDSLMDPAPWVEGDIFDAVMHYQWYKPARGYFVQSEDGRTLKGFQKAMDSVFQKYPVYTQKAMMNLAASHDSPRLASSIYNKNKYKKDAHARVPAYDPGPPTEEAYRLMNLFTLHQFTWIGSPHIWMGDEMGMFGGDDPDNRKPLVWDDITFATEHSSPYSNRKYSIEPKARKDVYENYKALASIRKSNPELIHGSYTFHNVGNDILAYTRTYEDKECLIIVNPRNQAKEITLPAEYQNASTIYAIGAAQKDSIEAMSAIILKK